MLYRNPQYRPTSPFAASVRWLAAFAPLRRHRVNELELMSLGPHMRRDLGLDDASLADLVGRK